MTSIQFPGENTLVTELATQPINQGPNSNIGAVLSFKTKIPVDPLYCPNLTCTVYDFLLSGKSQPILGNFTLDLHEVYKKKILDEKLLKKVVPLVSSSIEKVDYDKEIEAKIDPKIETKIGGKIEAKIEAKIETKIEAKIEAKIETKIEEKLETIKETAPLLIIEEIKDSEEIKNSEEIKDSIELKDDLTNNNTDDQTLISYNKSVVVPETIQRESFTVLPMSLTEASQPGNIVIMPQFKISMESKKLLEIKQKNPHYVGLGYNRVADDGFKHYRYALPFTLEKSELFGSPPFECFAIKKGQNRGASDGFFSFMKKSSNTEDLSTLSDAGVFKGLVRIKNVNTIETSESEDSFEKIARLLLIKNECLVRVYIIDALNLEQKDLDSPSDPYLVIKLGNTKISDREHAIFDNPNPKFLKHFDIITAFPGDCTLKVQVWDHDDLFSDDKIGTTKIDLEDRFFNESWKSMPEKPVETRKLLIKSCKQPQGYLRMWVEIHPSNSIPVPWDISAKPPEKFEMRLII